MSFASPYWLLALLAVPLAAGAYAFHVRRREQSAAVWATPALVPNLVDRSPGIRRHLPFALLLVAVTAMIVGVARPHATVTVRREEATVLLAIDVSRSMAANDVQPTRLRAAQRAAHDFVDEVPAKYRVGVVSFSTRATVAVPPTEDRSLVHAAINSLHTGEGTAIGDAVLLSTELGKRQRGEGGTIPPTSVLLISDGAPDGGQVQVPVAIRRARALKVPVYTIALGTQNGIVRHRLPNGFVETLQVPPDPKTLQQIARGTGGAFFAAANDDRLSEVYAELRSRLGHKKQSRELTDLFAAGAGALLLGGGALSALWFRRLP